MRTILYIFFLLMFTVLIACSTKEANESVRQQVPERRIGEIVDVAERGVEHLRRVRPVPMGPREGLVGLIGYLAPEQETRGGLERLHMHSRGP